MNYRFAGKDKTLALGVYPDVSLAAARRKRDEAREKLAGGIDPGAAKKVEKRAARLSAINTFESVALAWMEERCTYVEPAQHDKTLARFKNDAFPWLGKRPVAEIDAPEILDALKRVDSRGARYTAHRLRGEISRVFRYGIKEGLCKSDPARDLIGAIPPAQTTHFAAITDRTKVGEMLRAFDGFSGAFPVLCALKLAPMLFVRPGELRKAEWSQFDLDRAEWRYAATKTETAHLVPLAAQAVAILRELHALTGRGRYVFPGARSSHRSMSDAAINAALRRLGYDTRTEITGHGFRAMARTILHEELEHKPEVIEHQAVGPDMHLMLDPACKLDTFVEALEVGRACDEANCLWYEDPYERCLELDPSYAHAHHNLAILLDKRGDPQGLLRHLNAYRRLTI